MATAIIHGNLTRDPELSFHDVNGESRSLVKFSVAEGTRKMVNGQWTDGDPNYFDCVAWGREADHIAASVKKGDRVLVHANVKQNKWQNEEGENRSKIEFVVTQIGPSLQFAETPSIVKTNGPNKETKTESTNTEDF